MADLGEFGRAIATHDGEPDTFTFCGERFDVPAALSPLPLMRFAWRQKVVDLADEQAKGRRERAQALVDSARNEQERAARFPALSAAELAVTEAGLDRMAAMYEFMRGCLPDDESWARFESAAVRYGVEADVLMEVCSAIFAAVIGRPTSRPSESSDGPWTTGAASTENYAWPEPTPGPPLHLTAWEPDPAPETAPIRVLTENELQRAQIRAQMAPVSQLLAAP
jgi:hypothetical protein